MTERGKWEHHLDYLIENSWWAAIAFHLWRSGQFSNAFYFLALLIGSHVLDEFAKRRAKMAKGRLLDDVAPFDRAFRLIAARRNVYVWILACGFFVRRFAAKLRDHVRMGRLQCCRSSRAFHLDLRCARASLCRIPELKGRRTSRNALGARDDFLAENATAFPREAKHSLRNKHHNLPDTTFLR
jgi:hypothetical protein